MNPRESQRAWIGLYLILIDSNVGGRLMLRKAEQVLRAKHEEEQLS
jgi:hypothetical protein